MSSHIVCRTDRIFNSFACLLGPPVLLVRGNYTAGYG